MGRHQSEKGRKRQLLALTDRHREICRRLLMGQTHGAIADDLCVSRELVSIVKGSAVAQTYMDTLQADRDALVVDIDKELQDLAPLAVQTMEEALHGKIGGNAYDHARLRTAEQILDRVGYAKVAKVQGQINHTNIARETLAMMKARGMEIWRERKAAAALEAESQNPPILLEAKDGNDDNQ